MNSCHVYAVDTSNLWHVTGELRCTELMSCLELGRSLGASRTADEAVAAIDDACAVSASAHLPLGQTALLMAARHLGATQLENEVRARPGFSDLSGHWLVIAYRFADGSSSLRCAFEPILATPGPLPSRTLLVTVMEILRHDWFGSSGLLRERDRRCDGVRLHAGLQRALQSA